MITPEKNDVNIKPLFTWGRETILVDVHGKEIMKAHVRLVGDAELNRARVQALRASAEIRSLLKQDGSDENLAYIPAKNSVENETMKDFIVITRTKDASDKVAKSVDLRFPKEPDSDANLEQQEKYQKEVDEYPKKLNDAINAEMQKVIDKERLVIDAYDEDTLYAEFIKTVINDLCEKQMYSSFKEFCVYFGTYKDSEYRVRLFNSYDEFQNLDPSLKKQLEDSYYSLEVNIENLKK
jgi:hypothetical protein